MKMIAQSLYVNYLLPAIFLNPILFLHSLNTILSRILPPIHVAGALQPPPYSDLGPSGCHPHLDVHYSDNLCWSYTIVMVIAQLFAFDRVTQVRSEKRERRERKLEEKEQQAKWEGERESHRIAMGRLHPSIVGDGKSGENGSIAEKTNGKAKKSLGWAMVREESSSENDSLPPN